MKDIILDNVSAFISNGDKIAVAVSGGEDSMALLYAISHVQKDFEYFVINIEHGIRGEASKKDTIFVKDYCKKNCIQFLSISVDAKERAKCCGETLEEGARALRYNIFQKLIDDKQCNKVALAHHRKDQAETVLMRIMRGTGVTGLRGMLAINNGYIRPLLDVKKEDISRFVLEHNIPYVIDETNNINDCTRNIIRNEILPLMQKITVDAEGGLVRLSSHANETELFLETLDIPIIEVTENVVAIDPDGVHPYLLKRAIRRAFSLLATAKDIEERHVNIIMDFVGLDNGQRLDMPYNITVYREYNRLVFAKDNAKVPFNVAFSTGKIQLYDKIINIIPAKRTDIGTGKLVFDLQKIPSSATFRNREASDSFTKFGGFTKSLGDYLTDKKIPVRIRDNMPILAFNNDVLCVVGVEISDHIKIDENTKEKDIYCITEED